MKEVRFPSFHHLAKPVHLVDPKGSRDFNFQEILADAAFTKCPDILLERIQGILSPQLRCPDMPMKFGCLCWGNDRLSRAGSLHEKDMPGQVVLSLWKAVCFVRSGVPGMVSHLFGTMPVPQGDVVDLRSWKLADVNQVHGSLGPVDVIFIRSSETLNAAMGQYDPDLIPMPGVIMVTKVGCPIHRLLLPQERAGQYDCAFRIHGVTAQKHMQIRSILFTGLQKVRLMPNRSRSSMIVIAGNHVDRQADPSYSLACFVDGLPIRGDGVEKITCHDHKGSAMLGG
jgi:hypothetical protein